MKKYVRVIDGTKSNQGGFEFKIDEVNISSHWNSNAKDSKEMGGFNFSTEDKILRWLHRGTILYDVIIPDDAEVLLCDEEKGVYRTNKIIVTNPREITDEIVMDLCKKTTLSDKIIAQCLVTMLWRKRTFASKYLIKNRVTLDNINEIINEFENYISNGKGIEYDKLYDNEKEVYDILKEMQSNLLISLYIDKKPYIKELTKDKVINVTGQSGSGKSTYVKENFNNDNYIIIDTDEIFGKQKTDNKYSNNIKEYFTDKYKDNLPTLSEDFDLIYEEILNYFKEENKTIVIDCAQFHCIKDITKLKGKIIIIRTCIDTCYNRTIERYKKRNPNYTEDELNTFKERKKAIFKWYKGSNEFIKKIDKL